MPIKHLEDRRRYVRLGRVRLGIQVPVLTDAGKQKVYKGKPVTRPKATDYFVIKGSWPGAEEDVAALYGEQPNELDIEFLFEDPEETFPQYLKLYRGDGQLRCMGDGLTVLSRRHFFEAEGLDVPVIADGRFSTARMATHLPAAEVDGWITRMMGEWQEQYDWGADWQGEENIPCLGTSCPRFGPTGCRSTGRLLFGIKGVRRFGFWEMVAHQYAVVGINSQLELTRAFTSKFLGHPTILNVPFKMRLSGPTKMKIDYMDKEGNPKSRSIDVWTPEIQPDPEWVDHVCGMREGWMEQLEAERTGEPKALKPPVKVRPEDTERLEYEPGVEDDENSNGGEPETREAQPPARGTLSSDPMTTYWLYAKEKDVEGSAKAILEQQGGDPSKALIILRENCGDI